MLIKGLRRAILVGLVAFLPIAVTTYVIWAAFRAMDGILGWFWVRMLGHRIPGLGLLTSLALILIAGYIATNFIGKRVIAWLEKTVTGIPILGSFYHTIKQFTAIGIRRIPSLEVVTFDYSESRVPTVGLLIGNCGLRALQDKGDLCYVYVMTPPNPITGILLIAPREEIHSSRMNLFDGMKLIFSLGVLNPIGPAK